MRTVSCWAASTSRPAPASVPTRRATPAGKRQRGRNRTPTACTGPSNGKARAATPRVVPPASTQSGPSPRGPVPAVMRPYAAYVAMTTSEDSSGASATARNRWWLCSTPDRTRPTPYKMTCGAKTANMRVPWCRAPELDSPSSAAAIGRRATAMSAANGMVIASTQVSKAEAISSAPARSPRPNAPASSGTVAAARTPPAATSKRTLGTVFMLWYASPTRVAPTVPAKTSVRMNPATRANIVTTAIVRALAPMLFGAFTRDPTRRGYAKRGSTR